MSGDDALIMGTIVGAWLSMWAAARLWAVTRRTLWD